MAVDDNPDANSVLYLLISPVSGEMDKFRPTVNRDDAILKANQSGSVVVGLPIAVVYDGRAPGSRPYNPRPGRPQVDWPTPGGGV